MSPAKQTNWTALVMTVLAVLGFLGGLRVPTLRWALSVEERLHDQERQNEFYHGHVTLPKE